MSEHLFPRIIQHAATIPLLPPGSVVLHRLDSDPEAVTIYQRGGSTTERYWFVDGKHIDTDPELPLILLYIPPGQLSPRLMRSLGNLYRWDPVDEVREELDKTTEFLNEPTIL